MSPTRPGLAGAYWLIDEIAFAQRADKRVAGETFQLWKLTVNSDHTATEDDDVHPKSVAWFGNAVEFALAALAPPGDGRAHPLRPRQKPRAPRSPTRSCAPRAGRLMTPTRCSRRDARRSLSATGTTPTWR
jgi:hypothetical protein